MKTIVILKCFVTDCLWKPFLDCNLAKAPSNLILLTILVNVRPWFFTWFYPRAIKLQKKASDLFTEVDIWY